MGRLNYNVCKELQRSKTLEAIRTLTKQMPGKPGLMQQRATERKMAAPGREAAGTLRSDVGNNHLRLPHPRSVFHDVLNADGLGTVGLGTISSCTSHTHTTPASTTCGRHPTHSGTSNVDAPRTGSRGGPGHAQPC